MRPTIAEPTVPTAGTDRTDRPHRKKNRLVIRSGDFFVLPSSIFLTCGNSNDHKCNRGNCFKSLFFFIQLFYILYGSAYFLFVLVMFICPFYLLFIISLFIIYKFIFIYSYYSCFISLVTFIFYFCIHFLK